MKGGLGGTARAAGDGNGFQRQRPSFSIKNRSKIILNFNMFLTSFFDRFGRQKGAKKGAKIDQNRAKLVPRRLLKRFFVKKVNFHENL